MNICSLFQDNIITCEMGNVKGCFEVLEIFKKLLRKIEEFLEKFERFLENFERF